MFINFIKKHKRLLIVSLLLLVHIFLRFYQIDVRLSFSNDQLESAWAAKNIIVDHNFPILGAANRLGSHIFIGPLYFYLISIFYFFTNLDPIAAGLFAGVTSIFSFFVIFFITKKLFSFNTACVAVFINTVSFSGIQFDRMQWEINFIPSIALIGFYALYKITKGEEKYLMLLALIVGLAFHVHITIAVFLSLTALLALPFFPRTKKTLRYCLISLPIFLALFSPLIIANLQTKNNFSGNVFQFLQENYHGLHLTRVLQLTFSAMIQIESFFTFSWLRPLSLAILPLFLIIYCFKKPSKETYVFSYLVALWFIVPWIILSAYSGEVTHYYFSFNRFIALIIISYLIMELLKQKRMLITVLIITFGVYYSINNMRQFFSFRALGLRNTEASVRQTINQGKIIQYKEGKTDSYLYYIYTRKNKTYFKYFPFK